MKRLFLIVLLSFSVASLFGMDYKIKKFQKNGHLLCAIAEIDEVLNKTGRVEFNWKSFIQLQAKLCRKLEKQNNKFKNKQIKFLAEIWCKDNNSSEEDVNKYIWEVRECYGQWLFGGF